jgi:hypothetical protein
MLFIQYKDAHNGFEDSFKRGCSLFNIAYKKVYSLSEIPENTTLVWSTSEWINPTLFPNVKFMFGPQFFVFPDKSFESDNKEYSNCYYNCLCDWNLEIHNHFLPKPKVPYIVWPFGINTEIYRPIYERKDRKYVLVYFKDRNSYLLLIVTQYLEEHKIPYKLIIYGSYNQNDYDKALEDCKLGIWIGRHESQGYALQQALSMDIPLLVLDIKSMKEEIAKNGISPYVLYQENLEATAVPYWDSKCGERIYDLNKLGETFYYMLDNLSHYSPREFIINNVSDKVSFVKLLNLFNLT